MAGQSFLGEGVPQLSFEVIGEFSRSRSRAMGNAAGGCMDRDLAEAAEQGLL